MGYEALVEDRQRHVRLLEITPELILELFKVDEGKKVTINGRQLTCVGDAIPQSATVASCGINERGNVLLHVEDATFSPLLPGCLVPRIQPMYRLVEQERAE
jgi:hypothetical protein